MGERGEFDAMVFDQIKEVIAKRLEELEATIANAEPAKKEAQEHVDGAQEVFDVSKEEQKLAARNYMQASDETKALEEKLKSYNTLLIKVKKELRTASQAASRVEQRRDWF